MSEEAKDDFAGYATSDEPNDFDAARMENAALVDESLDSSDNAVSVNDVAEPVSQAIRTESTDSQSVATESNSPPQPAQQQASQSPTAEDVRAAFKRTDDDLDALAQRYEDGEISFKEYRSQEREINDRRARIADYQRQQEYTQQRVQQDWDAAVTSFMSDEANKVFGSPELLPMMKERIHAAWQDQTSQNKPYQQVLSEAAQSVRATLRQALGLQDTTQPLPKEVADIQAKREERLRTSQSTPARGSKAPAAPTDPWEGYAAP